MEFLQQCLIATLIGSAIGIPLMLRKTKMQLEAEAISLLRQAHMGEPLHNDTFWWKNVARDMLCCPLTSEQLALMKACDTVETHEVKIQATKYAFQPMRSKRHIDLLASIYFVGWQGSRRVVIDIDKEKIRLCYEFGDPGNVITNVSQCE